MPNSTERRIVCWGCQIAFDRGLTDARDENENWGPLACDRVFGEAQFFVLISVVHAGAGARSGE